MESRKGALEARERNPSSFYSHHCYAANDYQQGNQRNVLTCTILGGAGGVLHQLLSSISRENFYYWLISVIVCLGLSGNLPLKRASATWKSNSKCWTSRSNSKNYCPRKHPKLSKKIQESSRIINWVQKAAFDLCTGSQRCSFTGLKIVNSFISPSVTTFTLSNTHTRIPRSWSTWQTGGRQAASLLCGIRIWCTK